jgi:polysaccharide export outer membrane protein
MTSIQRVGLPAGARYLMAAALTVVLIATTGCWHNANRRIVGRSVDFTGQVDLAKVREVMSRQVPAMMERDYYLAPGDIIEISLTGVQQNNPLMGREGRGIEFELTESPTLSLHPIGAIRVIGKTPAQLQEDLNVAYSEFYSDPQPVVRVVYYAQNVLSIIGSVRDPGKFPYFYGDTLQDAIFRAGGLSPGGPGGGLAPARVVRVYRERLTSDMRAKLSLEEILQMLTVDGEIIPREEITIPLEEFSRDSTMRYNIPLSPNDIVYVPPAGTVHIHGWAKNPQVVYMGPKVRTVAETLNDVDGLRFGAASTLEVTRVYPDGQLVTYEMNIRNIMKRKTEDFYLADGDTVLVRMHGTRATLEWLGKFFRASISTGVSGTYNPGA